MEELDPIEVRRYGAGGRTVVVLHGGPGAPGSASGLGHALAPHFRVLEPLQRRSGLVPLTVNALQDRLAGESDKRTRDAILGELGAAYMELESYDLLEETEDSTEPLPLDDAGHNETWNDALRLQREGAVHPRARIRSTGAVWSRAMARTPCSRSFRRRGSRMARAEMSRGTRLPCCCHLDRAQRRRSSQVDSLPKSGAARATRCLRHPHVPPPRGRRRPQHDS